MLDDLIASVLFVMGVFFIAWIGYMVGYSNAWRDCEEHYEMVKRFITRTNPGVKL